MKILLSSNAPHVNSGYGVQCKGLLAGLRQLGHEVALAPNYGLQGGLIQADGIDVYPLYRDNIGQDVLPRHAKRFGAELVITLYDVWPYNIDFAAQLKVPWLAWFPQDSYPPAPIVMERLRTVDFPVAISRFGQESVQQQGVACDYIPHGVDVNVYKPLDKKECRAQFGIPEEKFVVLMVAANQSYPSRKAFPEALAAFAEFHRTHPDSVLHLHTTPMPKGKMLEGVELWPLIQALGIADAVIFTDEYTMALGVPDTEMAKIYNSADVLLNPSMGEGFGVPIIEAQACGVPVITTAFSSMPELTINGIAVAAFQRSWTLLSTWQVTPLIKAITEALEDIHDWSAEERLENAARGRSIIVRDYAWPVIWEHWRKLLAEIEGGRVAPTERLYHHKINGLEFDVWDDRLSFTTGCVAAELNANRYGLEDIDFQPGDIVLDVGGHTGLFAMYVAKRWPGVVVHSYEPSAINRERFERNLDMNCADIKNDTLFVWPWGVTADGRSIELALDRGNTGGTSEFIKPNGHLREQAHTKTLDDIIAQLQKPYVGSPDTRIKLLKIDAEGAEHEILTNAECLGQIDYISGEFHINSSLAKQGYSIPGLAKHLQQYFPTDHITYSSCQMSE